MLSPRTWFSVVATLFAVAPAGRAQSAPPTAGDDFFMPLPPRFVAGPMVVEAKWSPDGRYVAASAMDIDLHSFPIGGADPPHTVSFVVWNASTHKAVTVWSDSSAGGRIEQSEWVPGTAIVFLVARWTDDTGSTHQGMWRIDARRSGGAKVDEFAEGDRLIASPNQPYAFLQGSDRDGNYLKPLAANGSIGLPIRMPAHLVATGDWSADGRNLLLAPVSAAPKGSAPDEPKLPFMQCDGRSGAITALESRPKLYEPPARKYPFKIAMAPVPTGAPKESIKVPWGNDQVQMAWLEQGTKATDERFLIAANADRTEISPAGDGVLYVNSEGAFVVGLLRTPHGVVENARAAAQRTELLNNGKQIALAVIMWGQDNDDKLPGQDGDLKATLRPYVRNDSIFGGADGGNFVYTLNGGSLSEVKNPAGTMMGYIAGPGGYAVVYADGHVQWSTELPASPPSGG